MRASVCVCVWSLSLHHGHCMCAVPLCKRKNTEFNCSRSFHRFSRQIISGLCPLAPSLCPSRSLWPIITCHSFDLFISSSLGRVEEKRNPLISGAWLYFLHGEIWGYSGKQQWERGDWGRGGYSNPQQAHIFTNRDSRKANCHYKCISITTSGNRSGSARLSPLV